MFMSASDDVRSFTEKRYALMALPLIRALESRRFAAYYCPTAAEAVKKALSLMPSKSSVSWGGSYTLDQIGLTDAVRAGPYRVLDRADVQTPEEKLEVMRRAMFCDVFLTSFNAVSMDGTVFNIDGNGNRVAAITFGPASVIAVVGMNKVCSTPETALARARNVAAPLNAIRFGFTDTPCTRTGVCGDCRSEHCICCAVEEMRMCKIPQRIKVILVGEELGF